MLKRVVNLFKFFVSLLVNWPLYIALKVKADILQNPYAKMWYEDAANFPEVNFFQLLAKRPYYRAVLFYRLRLLGSVLKCFYPTWRHFTLHSYKNIIIGGGLWLDHPYGSNFAAISIGKNFKTKHFVSIGKHKGKVPVIGNNVFIGAGAQVYGDITIGDNVQIGAGAVVMKDVPSNCTVIGNPAIIIKKDGERVNIPL